MLKTKWLTISLPILIILATLPLFAPSYYTALLITIFMYATLGVSWLIFSSYTGYISLAIAASFGIGAYVTVLSWAYVTPLPLPILIILGGLAAAIFSFIIGYPFLRVRGPYFIIATLGLATLLRYVFETYQAYILKRVGIPLLGPPSTEALYYALLIVGIITVITAQVIKNSKFGLGLFSIRGDEEAAEAIGVNTTWYKLVAFSISSLFMGSVGAIVALRWTWIEPSIVFSPLISFQAVIMAILGGWEDFRGPILGAVILTLISEAFGINYPYHYLIVLGITLIIMVKFLPSGLLGEIERFRSRKKQA